jgi:hypothetical protein
MGDPPPKRKPHQGIEKFITRKRRRKQNKRAKLRRDKAFNCSYTAVGVCPLSWLGEGVGAAL